MIILTRTYFRLKTYPKFNQKLLTSVFPEISNKKITIPAARSLQNSDLIVRDQGFEPWTP